MIIIETRIFAISSGGKFCQIPNGLLLFANCLWTKFRCTFRQLSSISICALVKNLVLNVINSSDNEKQISAGVYSKRL